MKIIQTLAVLLCSMSIYAQKTVATFSSQKLGGDRDLYITLPPSYEKDKNQENLQTKNKYLIESLTISFD